eukprot:GHRR01026784.1.p1 GENE.GHRR01026784.1~~GHRR01026784.1.p1  ORF type:complete len:347 (+),score=104.30 GHRR01026784.1:1049-2089(+)
MGYVCCHKRQPEPAMHCSLGYSMHSCWGGWVLACMHFSCVVARCVLQLHNILHSFQQLLKLLQCPIVFERIPVLLPCQHSLQAPLHLLYGHLPLQNIGIIAHNPLFVCYCSGTGLLDAMSQLPLDQQYVLMCLPVMGQKHVLMLPPTDGQWLQPLSALAAALCRVETFYDSMGGLIGYQLKSLQLILAASNCQANSEAAAAISNGNSSSKEPSNGTAATCNNGTSNAASNGTTVPVTEVPANSLTDDQAHVTYHVPPGLDLAGEGGRQLGVRAAAQGLLAMPYLSEILPVGGAGDRLGLKCEITKDCLPAAMLPYCGRTMMEGLIRDLQAKEYLYWHLTGTQVGET